MGSCTSSGECGTLQTFNISAEAASQWLYTPADRVIMPIVIPIICLLGILTNSTFLFVLFRVPQLRSDTNVYLAHLAVADVLYLCMTTAIYVWLFASSPVAFDFPFENSASCVSFILVLNTGYFTAIAAVTAVSYERYLALCHPIKHRQIRTRVRTYKMTGLCWLLGLLFASSTVPHSARLILQKFQWPDDDEYQDFPSLVTRCDAVSSWVRYAVPPFQNFPWLITMAANVYMYIQIVRQLNNRRSKNSTMERAQKALLLRNQVAKMLVVNGVIFFMCQVPYRILSFSEWICLIGHIPDPLLITLGSGARWISTLPQLINAFINPLVYGVMSEQYRVALAQVFGCKGRARQNNSAHPPFVISAPGNKNSSTDNATTSDTNETQL
ncbi:galanin receptor 2a-like [Patiria miniata]|uniref:G-protein coupled receptors family 1 profile domain-containing protein n=1 Tax=Patiria miniata TaxID=46514 RepID=A0A914A6D5_PATMI|nr:galanin receptor 2a-like [Patiria miniata]